MALPYLTAAEATARLVDRFALTGYTLADAYVSIASDEVDAEGPFSGFIHSPTQDREFPRTHVARGDVDGVVPDLVLDFVALRAAQLSQPDPTAPISSESADGISVSWAKPRKTKLETLTLVAYQGFEKYRRKTGVMV